MTGRYRYSPCNRCCMTQCDPGTTFIRVYVWDGCQTSSVPLAGATVTITVTSTGDLVGSAVTDSTGFVSIPIVLWTTYTVTTTMAHRDTKTQSVGPVTIANCGSTLNVTTFLTRNRIRNIQTSINLPCGWEYRSGTTATISQTGSSSYTVNGEVERSGVPGKDSDTAWFYFDDVWYIPGVPINVSITTSGPYTPNTLTGSTTIPGPPTCSDGYYPVGVASSGFVWAGRSCPNITITGPAISSGYICSPWGQVPASSRDPNDNRSPCGKPFQFGNLFLNDPQVGSATLSYLGLFANSTEWPSSCIDGLPLFLNQQGYVWSGTATYSSPSCSLSCSGSCTCTTIPCQPGTFPATTATVTYYLYRINSGLLASWVLDITVKYVSRSCSQTGTPLSQCTVAQFRDTAYLDTTLNPPLGVSFGTTSMTSRGSLVSATCPPAIVLEFSCPAFVPISLSGLVNGNNPCEAPKSSRIVTVTV